MKLIMENWRGYCLLEEKKRPAQEYAKKHPLKPDEYSFVFGRIGAPMEELIAHRPNKVLYGASMPKLPAALAQMIHFRGTESVITNKELSMLLDYAPAWKLGLKGKHQPGASSNEIFRSICRGDHKTSQGQSYARPKKKPKLGTVNKKKEEEFLKNIELQHSLPSICRSRPGPKSPKNPKGASNRQTTMGFFQFLSGIHLADQLRYEQESKGATFPGDESSVINTFYREYLEEIKMLLSGIRGHFAIGPRPEDKTYNIIRKKLGYNAVLYGKGGYVKNRIQLGIVIDETYVLSIYTDFKYTREPISKMKSRHLIADKIVEILANNAEGFEGLMKK